MFRPCLSLDIKHLSCLCATGQSLSHAPAFPGIPQAGPADQLQPEFRLALAQHSLYVRLLMTQPAFIRENCLPPMAQKNSLQVEKKQMLMCVGKRKHVESL